MTELSKRLLMVRRRRMEVPGFVYFNLDRDGLLDVVVVIRVMTIGLRLLWVLVLLIEMNFECANLKN